MINVSGHGYLIELLGKKNISEEERRKIVLTDTVLQMISSAITTQGSNHKLSEEMENFEKYYSLIESKVR